MFLHRYSLLTRSMDEQADLQARIAALAGKINQHKQSPQSAQSCRNSQQFPPQYRGNSRWRPYGGLVGRGGYVQPVRNRTLVLNGMNTPPATLAEPPPGSPLVSARGTNNQLMTKETYEREQRKKSLSQEQLRDAKRRRKNAEEQYRIQQHFHNQSRPESRQVIVNGVRFALTGDGSKLVRASDANPDMETPKRHEIAGVMFYRTKTGNLVRGSALTAAARSTQKQAPQCENFTKHGTCPFGPNCRFTHDPNKVAICKTFLKSGSCPRGDYCDMSHEMSYHRVPACSFFLNGNCTNRACRYPHVDISPAAPVCRAFATLGYCAKGAACGKRHVTECPDFANHGFCADRESGRCVLPHPDRASVLRKAAQRQVQIEAGSEPDLSSDEEEDSDHDGHVEDVDSDIEEAIMNGSDNYNHELTQQQDFVAF
ncbi:CCCH zinc finger protein [Teratosphaeria destructans]|uniref:CCCH zinc finger protein n=1 Tax=Teratosphaeria destructans TaxID=418781 RepID=A0A9W7SNF7_9PEZI|nr:CCCH zinc finger protein [Teratosphaeria destructans]